MTIKKTTAGKTAAMLSMFALACGLLFTNCAKDGMTGPAGPAGTNGTNGTNGNANVVSGTVTVTNWTYSSPSYYGDITYASITQSIMDKGAILVYLSNGSGGYSQLPLTIYPLATYSQTYEVVTAFNNVRIYITDSDLTAPNAPTAKTFKIVVIAAGMVKPNVNVKNYADVKAAYSLAD